MAKYFDFSLYSNGTTPEAMDAKWAGDSTQFAVVSGKLGNPTGFNEYGTVYEDSQGANQLSRIIIPAGLAQTPFTNGGWYRVLLHDNGTSTVGYQVELAGGRVNFSRAGVFISLANHSLTWPLPADVTLEISNVGPLISVKLDGVELPTSFRSSIGRTPLSSLLKSAFSRPTRPSTSAVRRRSRSQPLAARRRTLTSGVRMAATSAPAQTPI